MAVGYRTVGAMLIAAALLVEATGCTTAPARAAQSPLSAMLHRERPTASPPAEKGSPDQRAARNGQAPITGLTVRWEAGLDTYLLLYGLTSLPALQVRVETASQVISQVDLQTKNGEFLTTLHDPGPGVQADLVLLTVGSDATEVARIAVPANRRVGAAWSRHFAQVKARQLAPHTVLLSGEADGSGAAFTAQIRVNGRVVAEQEVQAAGGPFRTEIVVPEALPKEGVEAYLLLPPADADSDPVELFTRVD